MTEIDYGDWGELFFARGLTAERVVAGVNTMAGAPIEFGPLGVGPRRIAKASARGQIRAATGDQVGTRPATFRVKLPVGLDLLIDFGVDRHRYAVELVVPLLLTLRARDDLSLLVDVEPPSARDLDVVVRAKGMRASFTQFAADIDGELRRFVARYVAREIAKPYVVNARTIDVAGAIDRAVGGLGPTPGR